MSDPEDFWFPAIGDRFNLQAWDLWRVRVSHYDQMIQYLKVPVG